ncbi:MAG: PsbP-related protein [Nitrososphaeraceae archaeon]
MNNTKNNCSMHFNLMISLFFVSSFTIMFMFMFILAPIFFVQDPLTNKQFSLNKQQYGIIKEISAESELQLNQSIQNQLSKTFKNEYHGIQFEYPSTADLIEESLLTMSYSQLVSIFFEGNYKLPYLIIKLYPLSLNEQTLDDFTERFIKEKQIQIPGEFTTTVSILNSTETELAGNPAHELEYMEQFSSNYQNNNISKKFESKILSIWTINSNLAYELKFVGSNENYDRYLPEAKMIINSFKIDK